MKTTEKLRRVCCGRVSACTFVHISVIRFEISNRMKHQAIKDWKIQQCLVLSWQRVISEEQMC